MDNSAIMWLFYRSLLLLVVFVGAGTTLWLATLSDDQVQTQQLERNWPAATLYDQHQTAQLLRFEPTDVIGIRLWLLNHADNPEGTIFVRLRPLNQDEDIAVAQRSVTELSPQSATSFYFTPLQSETLIGNPADVIELRIETEGVSPLQAISIIGGGNRYGQGVMIHDGVQIARADLAFDVLYETRWMDRVLPITNIARSRPGIFGWPPFYALLVYSLIITIGYLSIKIIIANYSADPIPHNHTKQN
ncbi:MAG: hypothetical protein GFH27_549297n193 [Chloroflexi bacterium AL-W]|nr:hypothetical protein [Chloroflexi bacterium AL-N1]NOK68953.1 hypothetical protein [Chloroflexi bacterium AL-N10]NOK76936.1 hypothetical protein [Chloroflexi bacterium AL-N5]NOK82676.1 hypothetical protein [Chloroflexi bacterium AL-W]NOK90793.1 hypothetical protein [Chloroflexi bacterium AL-N15]